MSGIFFAGNFLSKSTGTRGVSEDISEYFMQRSWAVVTASSYKNRLLKLVDFLWTAWHKRREYQIASIEVYSYLAFLWAFILCHWLKILKKPYILVLHGGRLPEFARAHGKQFGTLLKSAKEVVTPSQHLQQAFLKFRSDIKVIPNGIDIKRYPFNLRTEVEPRLSWLRAFHRIYNPQLAIEVLRIVTEKYPKAELVMIGPDKKDGTFDEVNRYVTAHGITKQVRFTGAVPKEEVGQYLSQNDIFLNTTNYESFGVSVLEAAACGLCIVTTDAGELPYMWEDGVDALVVPVNDLDSMAVGVKRILTEPGLAEILSRSARKKAERFDWSAILPQWEKIISDLIEQDRIR